MSRRQYHVGFVGTGFIAEYHATAIRSVPGADLVALCDLNQVRAEAFAKANGRIRVFNSLDHMLADQQLDVIHILTPPDNHRAAAETVLKAGAHVFLEKPMCPDTSSCDTLLSLAEHNALSIGVNQNTLFLPGYEQLRHDFREGKLGRADHVTVTWSWEPPAVTHGPFDIWMLRDPKNIMLELGSHVMAHVVDLVGVPEEMHVKATNPVDLPGHRRFYRRWQIWGYCGQTAIDLRFSFSPGFPERSIHVRGTLGTATVDLENNTYVLHRHSRYAEDFGRYNRLVRHSRALRKQAWENLKHYALSKMKLSDRGNAFGYSISRSVQAFYAGIGGVPDERNTGRLGRDVIEQCVRIGDLAGVTRVQRPVAPRSAASAPPKPEVLVIGGTGFIGRELVRQLLSAGRAVRLMTRNPGNLPFDRDDPHLEVFPGTILNDCDTKRAVEGVGCVVHLARAFAKTWEDYYNQDVLATVRVAEQCLEQGVGRLIYTGTIASYYTGAKAGTITERTPLDPKIERRDHYARAKAVSETMLMDIHRERDLPVVVCRPGIVIGTGGTACHWGVGTWTDAGVCQLWGDGRNQMPFVLVEDVASALIAAMDLPGIEGESFNLVGDPCLSAVEFLEELERHADIELQVFPTPIWRYYLVDMFKWIVKVLVRHSERRCPSYRDWESRTAKGVFDCSKAKTMLGWRPCLDRNELIVRGIHVPFDERYGWPADRDSPNGSPGV